MSATDNKSLIRKYIEEVINTGKVNEIEKYVSPDYTEVFDGKRYPIGINGAKEGLICQKEYSSLVPQAGLVVNS